MDWLEWIVGALLLIPLPVLVLLAIRRLLNRNKIAPSEAPGSPPGPGRPNAGDREPRHPRPFAGAGAAALDEPSEDQFQKDIGQEAEKQVERTS